MPHRPPLSLLTIELSIPLHLPSFPSSPLDVTPPAIPFLIPKRKFVRLNRGKSSPTLRSCNPTFQNFKISK